MTKEQYFNYSNLETDYLIKKDKLLGQVIETIGHIKRPVDHDLYFSVVDSIVGQQISTQAHKTISQRILDKYKMITPEVMANADRDDFQSLGMSYRKVDYIIEFSQKVVCGEFDLESLKTKTDEEVILALSSLRGIGVWTAEMILLFCLQRPNVFSFGDLAIHRGLRMVYHHRKITKELFEKYRRRFTPYCSVASLYLWAVAGGQIEGMKDYAPSKKQTRK